MVFVVPQYRLFVSKINSATCRYRSCMDVDRFICSRQWIHVHFTVNSEAIGYQHSVCCGKTVSPAVPGPNGNIAIPSKSTREIFTTSNKTQNVPTTFRIIMLSPFQWARSPRPCECCPGYLCACRHAAMPWCRCGDACVSFWPQKQCLSSDGCKWCWIDYLSGSRPHVRSTTSYPARNCRRPYTRRQLLACHGCLPCTLHRKAHFCRTKTWMSYLQGTEGFGMVNKARNLLVNPSKDRVGCCSCQNAN